MAREPIVDAVIAVHDASRPVARAVQSLTESGLRVGDELRISVVCHNLPVQQVTDALPSQLRPLIRFLELADGIPSAAGPFNAGLDAATARYASIMGSDDYFEPGVLAGWLKHAEGDVDAVIAPQVHANGSKVRTPPTRVIRHRDLHPLKDRLSYRTAPLGLIRRGAIDRLGLRFPDGLRTGEDQSFSAKLWFGGGVIRSARGEPHYVVGADARERTSMTSRSLETELAFIDQLIGDPWFAARRADERRALAIKLVRIHVFASTLARVESGAFSADDQQYAAGLIQRMRDSAPDFERPFSIADRRALDAIADPTTDVATIAAQGRARRRFGRPDTLMTRGLSGLLSVEGPLRFMTASALV
jgi:Glycosyl transferase family 2